MIGDKVIIPGGDNFSKAINNLWKQNLFSNIQIYYTKLVLPESLYRNSCAGKATPVKVIYKGAKKSETEELAKKAGLVAGRVITENMKMIAVENIQKYYSEKGYKGITVKISEETEKSLANSQNLVFTINKGKKVRINQVNFYGNESTGTEAEETNEGYQGNDQIHACFRPEDSRVLMEKKPVFQRIRERLGFPVVHKTTGCNRSLFPVQTIQLR